MHRHVTHQSRADLSLPVLAEEQRTTIRNPMINGISALGTREYGSLDCQVQRADLSFPIKMAQAVSPKAQTWPPDSISSQTIRMIPQSISNIHSIKLLLSGACRHETQRKSIVSKTFRSFCKEIGVLARGLCLHCALEEKLSRSQPNCSSPPPP